MLDREVRRSQPVMTLPELMASVGNRYLWLNIPNIEDAECRQHVADILCLEPLCDDKTLADVLTGESWRERIVGNVLAVRKGPRRFAPAMLDSLTAPRGLAVVSTCAALVLALAGDEPDRWLPRLASIDRTPFDGDVGWSLDTMMFHLGWSTNDPGGFSPNDGQDFNAHLALFRWVADSSRRD